MNAMLNGIRVFFIQKLTITGELYTKSIPSLPPRDLRYIKPRACSSGFLASSAMIVFPLARSLAFSSLRRGGSSLHDTRARMSAHDRIAPRDLCSNFVSSRGQNGTDEKGEVYEHVEREHAPRLQPDPHEQHKEQHAHGERERIDTHLEDRAE